MISDYFANKLLDHGLGTASYTAPTTVYVALFTEDLVRQTQPPSGELSAGNYARVAVTFDAADDQKARNDAVVTFPTPNADWAPASDPVIAVAITDGDGSSGDPNHWLIGGPVCPFVILNGDPAPTFKIGGILAAFASCFPG